jgi:hypothetical protein
LSPRDIIHARSVCRSVGLSGSIAFNRRSLVRCVIANTAEPRACGRPRVSSSVRRHANRFAATMVPPAGRTGATAAALTSP